MLKKGRAMGEKKVKRKLKLNITAIIVAVIITIPAIYSLIFLGAIWDAYDKLDKLPVAVVNLDKGTRVTEQQRADLESGGNNMDEIMRGNTFIAGNKIVSAMKEDGSLKFIETSKAEGDKGLKSGKYKMEIIIPEDFSQHIISVSTKNPKETYLEFKRNPSSNYIGTKLAQSASMKIEGEVNGEFSKSFITALLSKTDQISSGFDTASNGAIQLKDGAIQLKDGTAKLATRASQLSQGVNQAVSGAKKLESGVDKLESGAKALDSGLDQVNSGAQSASEGAAKLKEGNTLLNSKVKGLNLPSMSLSQEQLDAIGEQAGSQAQAKADAYAGQMGDAIAQTLKSNITNPQATSLITSGILASPEFAQTKESLIAMGLDEVTVSQLVGSIVSTTQNQIAGQIVGTDIASKLENPLGQLMYGTASQSAQGTATTVVDTVNSKLGSFGGLMSQLKVSMQQLSDGSNQLADGTSKLVSGTSQLKDGSSQLTSGLGQLKDGTSALASGGRQLQSGASQLASGANTLDENMGKMSSGASELADGLKAGSDEMHDQLDKVSDKTASVMSKAVKAKDTEINPVKDNGSAMAPLMMAVGLWVAAMSLCLMIPFAKDDTPALKFWAKKLLFVLPVSIAFGLLMFVALRAVYGLEPLYLGKTYLTLIVGAMAFMSMLFLFASTLRKIGIFLMYILLVIQIAGSGGTYPIEISAPWVGKLNNYLPFTHIVEAFRGSLFGYKGWGHHFAVLVWIMVICLVLSLVAFVVIDKIRAKHGKTVMDRLEARREQEVGAL